MRPSPPSTLKGLLFGETSAGTLAGTLAGDRDALLYYAYPVIALQTLFRCILVANEDEWGKASHSFGVLNRTEWNNMFYKHLDHHLNQFGV